jgi:hypothetical protein
MRDSVLLYGTHNSGTGSNLVWWQCLFGGLLHLTSRCQSRSISEQLSDGIVLFNFQLCYYDKDWYFSHGLCIYDFKLFDALHLITEELSRDINKKIYIQVVLDKNFLVGQDIIKFKELVTLLLDEYNSDRLVILWCLIEGENNFLYYNNKNVLNYSEHYWTSVWGKEHGISLLDRLPLPKRHAKKYNSEYKESCKTDVLMLDFYEL